MVSFLSFNVDSRSVINYVPCLPSCPICLRALHAFVINMLMCLTRLRAFMPLLLTCFPFFTSLACPHLFTCFTCLQLFTCLTCIHFFMCLTCIHFLACITCLPLFTYPAWLSLYFFKYFPFCTCLMCFHFFMKCGTTHNQPQQAGIRARTSFSFEIMLQSFKRSFKKQLQNMRRVFWRGKYLINVNRWLSSTMTKMNHHT